MHPESTWQDTVDVPGNILGEGAWHLFRRMMKLLCKDKGGAFYDKLRYGLGGVRCKVGFAEKFYILRCKNVYCDMYSKI